MNFLNLITFLVLVFAGFVLAQESDSSVSGSEQKVDSATASDGEKIAEVKGALDGLNESYLETKVAVDKLSKFKISGYTQFQYRMAMNYKDATDTTGTVNAYGKYLYPVGDFSGGKFSDRVESVLQLRRARVKIGYETDLTQAYIQFDCLPFTTGNALSGITTTIVRDTVTDSTGTHIGVRNVTTTSSSSPFLSGGGVTIKDAYLRFTDPWTKAFSLKGGVFDRPFGFEIPYSSSSRESPERSRAEQVLFPGERDLGVSLEVFPSGKFPAITKYFNFKGGFFSGNGINVENDSFRDLIGRLGFSLPFYNQNLAIDGGVSVYNGSVLNLNDTLYSIVGTSFTGATGNKNIGIKRQYLGGDMQVYYDLPVIGGFSLRTEAYQGSQPGQKSNVASPKSDIQSSSAVYARNFLGYYIWYVQNLGAANQLVLKYDTWDPNTDLSGDDIASSTELAYSTMGLGFVHHWNENVKFTLYYDRVQNETSQGLGVYADELMDDVLTFRTQYKF